MINKESSLTTILTTLLFAACIWYVGFIPKQSDFWEIIIPYLLASGVYILFTFTKIGGQFKLTHLLWLALFVRIPLLFSWPNLSDDIYRFLWDGSLLLEGISPFSVTPQSFIENHTELASKSLYQDLYPYLNSPTYFTVYPPVNQGLFALASWFSKTDLIYGSFFLKLCLLGAEIWGVKAMLNILNYLKHDERKIILYALNPLIIIEGSGNLHFEVMMIAFFFIAIDQLQKNHGYKSAVYYGLSVLTKLQTLIFLPLFIRRLGGSVLFYLAINGLMIVVGFLFLLDIELIAHLASSLDLYFQRFEFNASIYYLFRWLGFQWKGYNMIDSLGPGLSILALIMMFILFLREKEKTFGPQFFKTALFAFCIYLILSTTIHPWYLSFPVALTLFTRYRFPILWSMLIPLTYINYSYPGFYENLWVVTVEYTLVFALLIYELNWEPIGYTSEK